MDKKEKKQFGIGTAAAGGVVAGAAGPAAAESLLYNARDEQIETPVNEQEENPENEQPIIPEKPETAENTVSQYNPNTQKESENQQDTITLQEPFRITEGGRISVDASNIIDVSDGNEDGLVDMVMTDLNHNNKPDLIFDTDDNGKLDTVVMDVEVDENGNLIAGGIAENITVEISDEQGVLNDGNVSLQDGLLVFQDDTGPEPIECIYAPPIDDEDTWGMEGVLYGPVPEDVVDDMYNGDVDVYPIPDVYGPDPSFLNDSIDEL